MIVIKLDKALPQIYSNRQQALPTMQASSSPQDQHHTVAASAPKEPDSLTPELAENLIQVRTEESREITEASPTSPKGKKLLSTED